MLMPSSERWGNDVQRGKHPIKIYTIDGVLIYQDDIGGDNTNKSPLGGVIYQSSASSMLDAIANPITYYGSGAVINQDGHSGDLYNYYWTSYSRGTDGGRETGPLWHNAYLDGYIPLRAKSIYDPCPYLYRIPSNGTYNQFTSNQGWTAYSYLSGANWNLNTLGESWLSGSGRREGSSSAFLYTGSEVDYRVSIASSNYQGYTFCFVAKLDGIYINHDGRSRNYGFPVRCIDFATLVQFLLTRHSSCKHGSALVSGVI